MEKSDNEEKTNSSKTPFRSIYDTSSSQPKLALNTSASRKISKYNQNDNVVTSIAENPQDLSNKPKITFSDFVKKIKKTAVSRSKESIQERQEAKAALTVKERGQIKRSSHLAHLDATVSNSKLSVKVFQKKPSSPPSIAKKLPSSSTKLTPVNNSKVPEFNKKVIHSVYDKLEAKKNTSTRKSIKKSNTPQSVSRSTRKKTKKT